MCENKHTCNAKITYAIYFWIGFLHTIYLHTSQGWEKQNANDMNTVELVENESLNKPNVRIFFNYVLSIVHY